MIKEIIYILLNWFIMMVPFIASGSLLYIIFSVILKEQIKKFFA